jgi:hypothetical protein
VLHALSVNIQLLELPGVLIVPQARMRMPQERPRVPLALQELTPLLVQVPALLAQQALMLLLDLDIALHVQLVHILQLVQHRVQIALLAHMLLLQDRPRVQRAPLELFLLQEHLHAQVAVQVIMHLLLLPLLVQLVQ